MKLAVAVLFVCALGVAPGFAKFDGMPPPSPPPPAAVHHAHPAPHPAPAHMGLLAKLLHRHAASASAAA